MNNIHTVRKITLIFIKVYTYQKEIIKLYSNCKYISNNEATEQMDPIGDNTLAKWKSTKEQTTIYKTYI
jgi:hypothetical protein